MSIAERDIETNWRTVYMKRYLINENSPFSTYEVHNAFHSVLGAHMYITKKSEREQIAESVFDFMNTVYDEAGLGEFKSFKNLAHFIDDSYLWYITYLGDAPDTLDNFDIHRVYVVSVFRQNHGLKMVGIAKRHLGKYEGDPNDTEFKQLWDDYGRDLRNALYNHLRFIKSLPNAWAEVSGKLEKHFDNVFTYHGIISPYELRDHKIFKDIDIDIDEIHYYRAIRKGETPTQKIAYGHIML